jgi:sulfur relay (sulfurtransferase) DsrF/TusC family protein
MRALNIIETAYRATIEEQDDPVLWITHVMKGAGAELGVLLRGNAVNYTVKVQHVSPLAFGARRQRSGPHLADAVSGLIEKGVEVHVVREDLADRGIEEQELVAGLRTVRKEDLPQLLQSYDMVWHW